MAKSAVVRKTIKNMLGGVSQQPPLQRLESQCEEMINCVPSLTEFLKRRNGVHFINSLAGNENAKENIFIDFIERGDNEAGLVTVDETGLVTVYNLNGIKIGSATNDYLASDNPKQDIKLCTIRDYNFLLNTTVAVSEMKQENGISNIECLVVVKQASYDQKYVISINGQMISYTTPKTNENGYILSAERVAEELVKAYELSGGIVDSEIAWDYAYKVELGVSSNKNDIVMFSSIYKGETFRAEVWEGMVCDMVYLGARITKGTTTAQPLGHYEGRTTDFNPISFYYYLEEDLINAGTGTAPVQKGKASYKRNVIWFNGTNSIEVGADTDDAYLSVIKNEVTSISELPVIAPNGYFIKVLGNVASNSDDYYIMFETEDNKAFSKGGWKEVAEKNSCYKFSRTTMPLALKVIKNNISVEPVDWAERQAGDNNTNPAPSFIGKCIKDVFFYKNRLGFITDDNIILSEAGEYFNFFQTTALALLDSDPIDVAVSGTKVSALKYVVPYAEGLFIYSDRSLYVLEYGDVLSTANVELKPVLQFDTSLSTKPCVCDTSIYYAGKKGEYNQIREYKPTDQTDQYGYSNDITSHIPKYISGDIMRMCVSLEDGIMFLINRTDTIFCYSFIKDNGELLLSSWHKWEFQYPVFIATLFKGWLYLVFRESSGRLYLGKLAVSDTDDNYVDKNGSNTYLYGSTYTYSTYYLRDSSSKVLDIPTIIRTVTIKYTEGSDFRIAIERKGRMIERRMADKKRDFTRFLAASGNKDISITITSNNEKPFNIIETDLEVVYASRS